jgi:FSR family fosmidomycin resistance protein-like MFS transporter
MSFFAVGGNLGFAIGPALATPLQLRFGLRGTVFLVLPALAMALVLLRTGSAAASSSQSIPPHEVTGGEPDRWWAFLRLSAPVICRAIVFYGLNTFIPLYWIQSYGASKAAGATALTLMLSAGVVGTLLGGWLADRFGRRVVVLLSMLALAPLLWEFVATPSRPLALALLVPIGLALYAPFSVMTVMGQEYLPGRVGTASGLTIGLAVTLGGLAAPLLGRIADLHGVRTALSTLVAVPVAGALATLTLPRDAHLSSHR